MKRSIVFLFALSTTHASCATVTVPPTLDVSNPPSDATGDGAHVDSAALDGQPDSSHDDGQPVADASIDTRSEPDANTDAGPGDDASDAIPPSDDAAPGGFVHPGVLVDRGQLDFVKRQIMAGAAPWTAALARMRAGRYGSAAYMPHPFATVECGPSNVPNIGCSEEVDDAIAAYSLALLWYHTGDAAYAQRAIVVMNAWSSTITSHTNTNAPLQSAWVAEVFTRAAEIIRHTSTAWPASEVTRFASMLTRVYLPEITGGSPNSNGNWELSMTDGVINIGVFTDDHTLFEQGIAMWRARVPAYIYLTTDGALPVAPPGGRYAGMAAIVRFWQGQSRFVDGLTQETCRDLGHTGLGLGAMVNAAETARIQGVDFYAEQATRITRAYEFNTTYLNGAPVPSWLCGGTLAAGGAGAMLTFEIGYNEFATRLHMALPQTLAWISRNRPTAAALHLDWETLTHAGTGSAGIQ